MPNQPEIPQWEVGKLLQRARENAGLSKSAAARAAGLSLSRWHHLENGFAYRNHKKVPVGTPPAETLVKAGTAVGLTPREILTCAGIREEDAPIQLRDEVIEIIQALNKDQLIETKGYLTGLLGRRALRNQ